MSETKNNRGRREMRAKCQRCGREAAATPMNVYAGCEVSSLHLCKRCQAEAIRMLRRFGKDGGTSEPAAKPELKPCPFCGSANVDIVDMDILYAECNHCGATGPDGTQPQAGMAGADGWNAREAAPPRVRGKCAQCGHDTPLVTFRASMGGHICAACVHQALDDAAKAMEAANATIFGGAGLAPGLRKALEMAERGAADAHHSAATNLRCAMDSDGAWGLGMRTANANRYAHEFSALSALAADLRTALNELESRES